ncbi:Transcription factor WhiB [Friedmanniella luteola]|uniref:Transcription factor WhiB n=1 Tax=Friedmanniella luteola TaxID=546871 RepID=A0A1H1QFH5_9ACTN|nr:Transcription factor WhiB [Friedmanniella luteola]
MDALEKLTRALVQLASRGDRPRCGDPVTRDYWTSDNNQERKHAAAWCAGCPVLNLCSAAADETSERFGVWAGVDRTPRPRPESRKASA